MTSCVVDASALVLAVSGKNAESHSLRERLATTHLHAPHLIDAEVGNVLRRHVLAGRLADDEARMALRAAGAFVALRYPHVGTLGESAWALRHKLSFYDALYAALAAELGMPLLTADARLTKAPDLPCTVEFV